MIALSVCVKYNAGNFQALILGSMNRRVCGDLNASILSGSVLITTNELLQAKSKNKHKWWVRTMPSQLGNIISYICRALKLSGWLICICILACQIFLLLLLLPECKQCYLHL